MSWWFWQKCRSWWERWIWKMDWESAFSGGGCISLNHPYGVMPILGHRHLLLQMIVGVLACESPLWICVCLYIECKHVNINIFSALLPCFFPYLRPCWQARQHYCPSTSPATPLLWSGYNTALYCEVKGALCLHVNAALGGRICLLLPRKVLYFSWFLLQLGNFHCRQHHTH